MFKYVSPEKLARALLRVKNKVETAVSGEARARSDAISAAITNEVANRNTAIGEEASARASAISAEAAARAAADTAEATARTAAVNAKYTKPSDGIPKSDLAAAVQTSLGKADTALQTHQSLAAYDTSSQVDAKVQAERTYVDGTFETKTNASNTYVKFSASQSLSTAQKSTARANIGAGTGNSNFNFPVGYCIISSSATVPSGFLKCDGSSFSATDYPALYAFLGTNRLPNYSNARLQTADQIVYSTAGLGTVLTISNYDDLSTSAFLYISGIGHNIILNPDRNGRVGHLYSKNSGESVSVFIKY